MDRSTLETASTYVNNLLLARGLLRDGKLVNFPQLAASNDKVKDEQDSRSQITVGVINLVHDLVLRRDRDQDHQENLAFTLRSLRADAVRNTSELERLKDANTDLARRLALGHSSTRAAQIAAHSAEASARRMREDAAHLKTLLSQVRTQCANDIRKRDVQIQRLKSHLEARQRGNKAGVVGPSIQINPGQTGRGVAGTSKDGEAAPSVDDAHYSLKQETTEFLTQLGQSLSDENDQLLGLIKRTVGTLQDLQGLSHNHPGSPKSLDQITNSDDTEDMVHVVATSFDTLSGDLRRVMSSLSDLLTNPSFAPIEEVHVRDEEIQRLREGWVKMEKRWQEAVTMMQGWRKRMMSGGDNVNLDEVKLGLGLGEGTALDAALLSANLELDSTSTSDCDHEHMSDEWKALPMDDLPEESSIATDDLEAPLFHNDRTVEAVADQKVEALQETSANANVGHIGPKSALSGSSSANKENTSGKIIEKSKGNDTEPSSKTPSDAKKSLSERVTQRNKTSSTVAKFYQQKDTSARRNKAGVYQPSLTARPKLTVEQKLKHADEEARRVSSSASSSILDSSTRRAKQTCMDDDHENQRGITQTGERSGPTPIKRTRIAGKPRRRKSTLSPEELEELMKAR